MSPSQMMSARHLRYYVASGALFLLICAIIVSACDFLDRDPKGAVNQDILAQKAGGVKSVLMGTYSALSGVSNQDASLGGGNTWESAASNWIYGAVAGGVAHKGSVGGDQAPILTIAKMDHTASSGFFDSLWQARYEGISRANSVLTLLGRKEDLTEEQRNSLAGEARFLRGHFYFDLQRHFGNIPWIDETTENEKQPNTGEGHPNVWQKIEEDFQFAMNNLPESQSEVGRANRWAAAAYLAKTHLYQEEWQEAASLFDEVISSGVNSRGEAYALVPRYQNMFNAATENNTGTVFSIQSTGADGSGTISNARGGDVLNYPNSPAPFQCCGFFQPTLFFMNSFRVDPDTGLPLSFDPTEGENVKHDQGVSSTESFSLGDHTLDPRLDWTVGRRGIPYHDWRPYPGKIWTREQAIGGPFAPKKHIFRRSQQDQFGTTSTIFTWGTTGSAVNYKVIRFADVLLMAAEAHAELGNLEQAREYVNQVRERASNPESRVTNDLNREFALAVVDNEADVLATDPGQLDWVVRTDRNSTFVFLGGDPSNIDNWNEYKIPDYKVEPYPSSAFSSRQAALRRIRFERKLELGMEGHRFYDLVRWGLADERLDALYAFETKDENIGIKNLEGGDFNSNKNELYPIPQRQIDLMTVEGESVLEQNPGYQ